MMEAVHQEDVPCLLGCARKDTHIVTGRDLLHDLPGEFTVVKCATCGLMRTNPRPTPSTMGIYYPDDYGPYLGTRVQQARLKSVSRLKTLLKSASEVVFNFNTTPLPQMKPGRMLEIGCASGAFMHQMSAQGWTVQGVEASAKAAQTAALLGYSVHAGPLETAPRPDEAFDLIVGWMVLEHLHNPVACLKKLREWAKPGAQLVLSVPNAGSMEFNIFRDKWYALQLPTHIHHFTPKTLRHVLQLSGWELEKIHHQRVLSNLIASTGYILREKGFVKMGKKFIDFPERAGKWNYALYPVAWLFGMFGQTGRMTIWARNEP